MSIISVGKRVGDLDIRLGIPPSKPQFSTKKPIEEYQQITLHLMTVAQGATEILETITGQEESGVFDDLFGGIGDVFGNVLEGY